MDTVGSRLRNYLDIKDLTKYKLSKLTGISEMGISRIINNVSKPNKSTLYNLSNTLDINLDWLLTGEGEMFKNLNYVKEPTESYQKPEAITINYSEMNIMLVPIVSSYAYAGYLGGFGDQEYLDELPKIAWVDDKEHRGEYLCFEVRGDSMDDGTTESIMENDIILCRNVRQDFWKSKLHISKWDFVIVHKEKGILVKRIIKHDVDAGTLTLHSLNDYYEDFEIHLKDVAKILNVVDLKRKHKRR